MRAVLSEPRLRASVRTFHCMGTTVSITVVHDASDAGEARAALGRAQRFFRESERRFTRFDAESELSRLNRAGRLDHPSGDFVDVLERAARWVEITDEAFNPAVLPALMAIGYDADFGVVQRRASRPARRPRPVTEHGFQISRLDGTSASVKLAAGTHIDLGGIVKGWAAGRAGAILSGFGGYLVDAGGDIAAGGSSPGGGPWIIGVADPEHSDDTENAGALIDAVELRSGGLATSSVRKRSWPVGDRDSRSAHHIIDPARGVPADSGVIQATVAAESAEAAEVLAKSIIVLGPDRGPRLVESMPGVNALLALESGAFVETAGWAELRPAGAVFAGAVTLDPVSPGADPR